MMKKVCILMLAAMLGVISAWAMPVISRRMKITLNDGRVVEAVAMGDEFMHYYKTDDGLLIRQVSKDKYEVFPQEEFQALLKKGNEQREAVNKTRMRKPTRSVGSVVSGLKGSKRGLVILVNFSNKKFSLMDDPHKFYDRMFNEPGFNDYAFQGSVRDYFLEQSYGEFAVDFDVVGPYTLRSPYQYYGQNANGEGDMNSKKMAWEAAQLADADVDFSAYDWDGDGTVEHFYIIYAGYGENYAGNDPDYVWGHSASVMGLTGGKKLDGKTIATYACSSEIQGYEFMLGKPGYELQLPEGIGVPCHEFSHCLGYPDFYDVDYSGTYTTGYWDLMSAGGHNGTQYKGQVMYCVRPACYTAYERMAAGWLEPKVIDKETQITGMKPLGDEAREAYILYNDGNKNEYFLLENRQHRGFDAGLPGHGLLITHVLYEEAAWLQNRVNVDKSKPRMTILPADVKKKNEDDAVVFPGTSQITRVADNTSHGAFLYNKNTDGTLYLHKALEYITENEDGTISFLACRPNLATPTDMKGVLNGTELTVSWPAIQGATTYEVEYSEFGQKGTPEEELKLKETFAKCYKSSNGFTDIASTINTYTDNKAFSGQYLYQSPNYLKIGTGTKNGKLETYLFERPATGYATFVLGVKPDKNAVSGTFTVKDSKEKTLSTEKFSFSEAGYLLYTIDLTQTDKWFIEIAPTSVMYMNYLAFYNGEFSAEELGITAMNTAAEKSAKAPRRASNKVTTPTTSYVITNAKASCRYEVRVRALDDVRESDWSEILTIEPSETPVKDIQAGQAGSDSRYYDLQGRIVTHPRRGLYIHNGKKVVK